MRHPAGGPMARGRLAKIGMLRRLMRVKSTLPRRPSPLAAPCLTAPRLAAPFPSLRRHRAVLLAVPPTSPCRLARRRYAASAAPPAALLATVALLHIPLVGIAFLHAQSPRSAQQRHSNGTDT